jgi:hypothetical protein
MNAENQLQQEMNELRLLVQGLSKISGFPSELLELIDLRVGNISDLICLKSDDETSNNTEVDIDIVNMSETSVNMTPINLKVNGFSKSLNDMVSQSLCVNDLKETKRLVDISKLLTLNDRFRFQREFFGNDAEKMSVNLEAMNKLGNIEDALVHFRKVCPLGEESDCFPDFYMMLEKWFPDKTTYAH